MSKLLYPQLMRMTVTPLEPPSFFSSARISELSADVDDGENHHEATRELLTGGDGANVQGSGGGGGGGGFGPGFGPGGGGGGVGGFAHFPAGVQVQCAAVHVALSAFVEQGFGMLHLPEQHVDPGAAAQATPQHAAAQQPLPQHRWVQHRGADADTLAARVDHGDVLPAAAGEAPRASPQDNMMDMAATSIILDG